MIIPAIIGAAGAIGSSLLGTSSSNRNNERLANLEFGNNVKMWNMQNEYNTPMAQMQRLRDAGLNPNMMYGNGTAATGNATSSPQYHKPTNQPLGFQDAILPILSAHADMQMKRAQTNNLDKQNAVIEAQAVTEAARAINMTQNTAESAARTARSRFDLGMAEVLKQNSMDVAFQNLANMRKDMEVKNASIASTYEGMKYEPIRRDIGRETLKNMSQSRQKDYYDTLLKKYEYGLNQRGIQKGDSLLWRQLIGPNGFGGRISNAIENGDAGKIWNSVKENPKSHLKAFWKFKRFF